MKLAKVATKHGDMQYGIRRGERLDGLREVVVTKWFPKLQLRGWQAMGFDRESLGAYKDRLKGLIDYAAEMLVEQAEEKSTEMQA